ncbi:hypothetical protein OAM67_01285 [bacterium]|nr:hypothetical protein [bacterium]
MWLRLVVLVELVEAAGWWFRLAVFATKLCRCYFETAQKEHGKSTGRAQKEHGKSVGARKEHKKSTGRV